MKNLILYNIFAALAMFGVTAMQDGASGPGAPTGSPLKRINSQTQLLLRAEGDEFKSSSAVGFDYKPYIAAHKPQLESICNGVRHCCSRLGVKKMTIYDKSGEKSTTVDALDISWGSIRSYAHKVLGEDKICLELKERLGDYLSILDNVTDRTRADIECNSTAFEGDELERLCAMCFEGEDSLFQYENDPNIFDPNIFKETLLVPTLRNFTGFQTIASLMIISLLNQGSAVGFNEKSKINVKVSSIFAYCPSNMTLYVPLNIYTGCANIDDVHITFTHECLHAVSDMLGIFSSTNMRVFDEIVNSVVFRKSQLDYVDLFAPIMKNKELHDTCIKGILSSQPQKGKNGIQPVRWETLDDIMETLVKNGVDFECWNFSTANAQQARKKEENVEMEIRAVCLGSLHLATSCPAADKLVMYGVLPLQYNGRPFVVCSRQNEYIMTKRDILSGFIWTIPESEKDWKSYRYHSGGSEDCLRLLPMQEYIPEIIDRIFCDLSSRALLGRRNRDLDNAKTALKNSLLPKEASFYPSSLLHRMATEKGSVSISEEAKTDIGDLFIDPKGLVAGL